MSTKVDVWNISYKKGQLIFRQVIIVKHDLDLTGLPELPADKHDEVVRRIYRIHHPIQMADSDHPDVPEFMPYKDAPLTWVNRLADAVIYEAGV